MDQFHSFEELRKQVRESRDYIVEVRTGITGMAIMAPHGGAIEPGTAAIAEAIAGNQHSYYAFKGIQPGSNRELHISSICFDEPRALALAQDSHTIITVPGCQGTSALVYVGGRDDELKQKIMHYLRQADIETEDNPAPGMRGIHPDNLCNRGRRGRGVQLEITGVLRRQMLTFNNGQNAEKATPLFWSFVGMVGTALSDI